VWVQGNMYEMGCRFPEEKVLLRGLYADLCNVPSMSALCNVRLPVPTLINVPA